VHSNVDQTDNFFSPKLVFSVHAFRTPEDCKPQCKCQKAYIYIHINIYFLLLLFWSWFSCSPAHILAVCSGNSCSSL